MSRHEHHFPYPQPEYPRKVTLAQAAQLYRAMNGDLEAQKTVTLGEVCALENAPSFERFLLYNKDRLIVYELEHLECSPA